MVWEKRVSPANDAKWFSTDHDLIVIYSKNKEIWRPHKLPRTEAQLAYYTNPDSDLRGRWNSATYTCNKTKDERPNLYYPITNPNTGLKIWPKETAVWKYGSDVTAQNLSEGRIYWGSDGRASTPRIKLYLKDMDDVVPRSVWDYEEAGHTQAATTELKELFGGEQVFDSPKPVKLLKRIIQVASDSPDDLFFDFFAGSGTTASAVLDLNREDGGNRKFILAQLPEPTEREDFKTISEITKERVRRVIQRHEKEAEGKLELGKELKEGFRVLKLGTSNFNVWNAGTDTTTPEILEQQLELHIDHIQHGRFSEDLLYEILLKSGFPLTTPVETLGIEGKAVYSVANGAMLICLDRSLTHEAIKGMAELKPERVVCLDEGFAGNDQLKTNAVLIMKAKGVTKFQTV